MVAWFKSWRERTIENPNQRKRSRLIFMSHETHKAVLAGLVVCGVIGRLIALAEQKRGSTGANREEIRQLIRSH